MLATLPFGVVMAKKPGRSRTNYNVSDEEFVRIWNTSNSIDEVSERTGMPPAICHARASGYRRRKVKMKAMPRRGQRGLDVDYLNRVVEEVEQEKGKSKGNKEIEKTIEAVLKKLEKKK